MEITTGKIGPALPAPVTGLTVTEVGVSSITVSYTAPATSFREEYSLDRGITWQTMPENKIITDVSGPQVIQVRAVNARGAGPIAGTRAGTLVDLDPNLLALVGASTIQGNHLASGIPTSSPRMSTSGGGGPIAIAIARTGMRLRLAMAFEITNRTGMGGPGRGSNNATGGRTLSTQQSVFNTIEASRAGVVLVSPERNDIVVEPMTPAAERHARYDDITHRARLQGREVLHYGIVRRGLDRTDEDWTPGSPFHTALVETDGHVKAQALAEGEMYSDNAAALADPMSAEPYSVIEGVYGDGSHYITNGAWLVSQALVDAIEARYGTNWPDLGATNPAVNLFFNPFMTGTDGTISSGATGTAPTGMTLSCATALAAGFGVHGETVTRDDITQYAITITPPGVPGEPVSLTFGRSSSLTLPLTAGFGTFIDFIARVERTDDAGGLIGYELSYRNRETPFVELRYNVTAEDSEGNLRPIPVIPHKARWGGLVAELITIPGVSNLLLTLRMDPGATTPWTFYTSEWCLIERDHKGDFPLVKQSADYNRDETFSLA